MPGDVTTNVTAVVSVVDKTAAGLKTIDANLAKVEETVKSINANVPTSLADMVKQVPGNIWNLPVRGADLVPDLLTPAQLQQVKVGGVFDRLRDKAVEVGASIKASLTGAFEQVWSTASRVLGGIASKLTSFGGLFVAGFGIGTAIDTVVGGMTDLVNTVEKLKPQADTLGTTVAKLQDLAEWAKESGVPFERVASGLENMQRNLGGIAEGAKGYDRAADALEKIMQAAGASATDVNTGKMRSLVDMMPDIAKGLSNIADPAERAKAAYDFMGQSWKTLLPMLEQGPEALAHAEEVMKQVGHIEPADVKAAQDYAKALGELSTTWAGFKMQLGGELLPAVTPALQELTTFLQENKGEVGEGFKLFVQGMIEGFKEIDAVVKSTADDIRGIKAFWDWLTKTPVNMPEWLGGKGVQNVSPGGGPLTVEDLRPPPMPFGQPANGEVKVTIENKNAPPGQTVAATTSGKGVTADVGQSMPWSAPTYSGPWAPGMQPAG